MISVASRLTEYQRLLLVDMLRDQDRDPVTRSDGQSAKALRLTCGRVTSIMPTMIEARAADGPWGVQPRNLRGARYRLTPYGRKIAASIIAHGRSLPSPADHARAMAIAVRSTGRGPHRPLPATTRSAKQDA